MKLKIFVNTWGNYHINGAEGGAWLSLPMGAEELEKRLEKLAEKMEDESPEWFVNDYETQNGFTVDENDDILELNKLAEELDALDESDIEKYSAILEVVTSDKYDALKYLDSYDFYPDATLEEVAQGYIDECDDIPDKWRPYIDVKMFARDMSFEGYHETQNGVLFCC